MLTIKTDIKHKDWLTYILEEFRKMNLADFDIQVVSLQENSINENIIYYHNDKSDGVSVFDSGAQSPSKDIEYLKDNLYILKNTGSENFTINYDLFWNAFVFLSRYEEYLTEQNGKNIYSYSLNHPRNDKKSFQIPIVNILFNELENVIKENFKTLTFRERKTPIVELTHDIDYIKKTLQLRLKQTAFNGFNTLRSITQPRVFISNLFKTFRFALSHTSYWCFDYWQKLENRHSRKSTFYVYVKNGKKDFRSWLIDPSYDIKTNMKLQKKLQELHADGFEIGLHGSYYSAKEFDRLKEEKEILEKILGFKITKTRQHWLNYFESITPDIHERLFKTDSTLAWNDIIGFRSGSASSYSPYDFKNKKGFSYRVIPQIVMDSNIYDYVADENIFQKTKEIIQCSKEISKTTHISLSWHQRVCSSDYNWHRFYEEILNDI